MLNAIRNAIAAQVGLIGVIATCGCHKYDFERLAGGPYVLVENTRIVKLQPVGIEPNNSPWNSPTVFLVETCEAMMPRVNDPMPCIPAEGVPTDQMIDRIWYESPGWRQADRYLEIVGGLNRDVAVGYEGLIISLNPVVVVYSVPIPGEPKSGRRSAIMGRRPLRFASSLDLDQPVAAALTFPMLTIANKGGLVGPIPNPNWESTPARWIEYKRPTTVRALQVSLTASSLTPGDATDFRQVDVRAWWTVRR